MSKTIRNIIPYFTVILSALTNAQEYRVVDNKGTINTVINNQVTVSTIAPTLNNISDIWFDSNQTPNTLNVWDGARWRNGTWPSKKVTNELYFEDNDYDYVSLLINATDWEVIRYTKADINTENKASGTIASRGSQPTTLAAVQSLTY